MDCVDRSKEKGFRTANVFVRIRPENVQEKKYKTVGNEKYLSDFTTKSLTVHKVRTRPGVGVGKVKPWGWFKFFGGQVEGTNEYVLTL